MGAILDENPAPKTKAAVFLCSLSFAFGQLGTNVSANLIPFGADGSALFPQYINIVRGQLICAVVGFAIVPWLILTSGATFLQFITGYGIFVANIVAIMIAGESPRSSYLSEAARFYYRGRLLLHLPRQHCRHRLIHKRSRWKILVHWWLELEGLCLLLCRSRTCFPGISWKSWCGTPCSDHKPCPQDVYLYALLYLSNNLIPSDT